MNVFPQCKKLEKNRELPELKEEQEYLQTLNVNDAEALGYVSDSSEVRDFVIGILLTERSSVHRHETYSFVFRTFPVAHDQVSEHFGSGSSNEGDEGKNTGDVSYEKVVASSSRETKGLVDMTSSNLPRR